MIMLTILAVLLGACTGLVLAFIICLNEMHELWRRNEYLKDRDYESNE
jgi:hypothetical protein